MSASRIEWAADCTNNGANERLESYANAFTR
jgi:hypothetical protein